MNKALLAAAAAGFALAGSTEAAPKKVKKVNCFGLPSQKAGSGACVVTKEQIKAAQMHFKGQYTKAVEIECKGNNECKSQVHLAWEPKKSKAECLDAKGFVFEKSGDGLKVVEK